MNTTRRRLLITTAGASALAAGCAASGSATQAERMGAFPQMPFSGELIGPPAGTARLHSNENPYGPAASALRMVEYAGKKGAYYADDAALALKDAIAERHGVGRENILLSHGSAEALSAMALVYGQKGPIVGPRLFFDATPLYAQRLGLAEIRRSRMNEDMSIDLAALEALVTPETGMVHICNPNNPTGHLLEPSALKASVIRMAKSAPVLVDEAYMELVNDPEGSSCLDLVRAGHNVVVARTFSKIYGMAGLRMGYIITTPDIADAIRPAIMSWLSGVSIAAAVGCYNDARFLAYSNAKVSEGREMVLGTLNDLGMPAIPSQTNFVFFKSGKPANDIRDALDAQKILVRGQYMDYADWTRVSVGRIEDVERFCQGLKQVVDA